MRDVETEALAAQARSYIDSSTILINALRGVNASLLGLLVEAEDTFAKATEMLAAGQADRARTLLAHQQQVLAGFLAADVTKSQMVRDS